jgi:hypothetical protein
MFKFMNIMVDVCFAFRTVSCYEIYEVFVLQNFGGIVIHRSRSNIWFETYTCCVCLTEQSHSLAPRLIPRDGAF